mmetsp:Transcript_66444/g.183570  ORF Transcript_66444/g.183570 Transcript_66444/m.183570 type:complete len:115 (+) Transcript_66444:536-880(+)
MICRSAGTDDHTCKHARRRAYGAAALRTCTQGRSLPRRPPSPISKWHANPPPEFADRHERQKAIPPHVTPLEKPVDGTPRQVAVGELRQRIRTPGQHHANAVISVQNAEIDFMP